MEKDRQQLDYRPEGTGYRANTRFARSLNFPKMIVLLKEAADRHETADMLGITSSKGNCKALLKTLAFHIIVPLDVDDKYGSEHFCFQNSGLCANGGLRRLVLWTKTAVMLNKRQSI